MSGQETSVATSTPEYAGFWLRTGASLIDILLLAVITCPLLFMLYGPERFTPGASTALILGPADLLISWVLPIALIISFWVYKGATPGKMAISTRIVDARTGGKPSKTQFAIRYLGYFVSAIPLGIGFFWVAFDRRKQGWHDKMAGTVVVRLK